MPVASKIYNGGEELEIMLSAIFSALINTAGKMSEQLDMGEPNSFMLKLDKGILIIQVIENRACCGIALPPEVNIPFFEIKIQELSKKVSSVLFRN